MKAEEICQFLHDSSIFGDAARQQMKPIPVELSGMSV